MPKIKKDRGPLVLEPAKDYLSPLNDSLRERGQKPVAVYMRRIDTRNHFKIWLSMPPGKGNLSPHVLPPNCIKTVKKFFVDNSKASLTLVVAFSLVTDAAQAEFIDYIQTQTAAGKKMAYIDISNQEKIKSLLNKGKEHKGKYKQSIDEYLYGWVLEEREAYKNCKIDHHPAEAKDIILYQEVSLNRRYNR